MTSLGLGYAELSLGHILDLNGRCHLPASPAPRGMPCKRAAAEAIDAGALAARGRGTFTPQILIYGIRAGLDSIPLTAAVSSLVESAGWRSSC